MRQGIKVLYMANLSDLVGVLHGMIEAGYEIVVVTPLGAFLCPNMDGVDVANWLIVYKVYK